jgi:hypothetical protein
VTQTIHVFYKAYNWQTNPGDKDEVKDMSCQEIAQWLCKRVTKTSLSMDITCDDTDEVLITVSGGKITFTAPEFLRRLREGQ